MTEKLLTLPFRLGFGAARTALHVSAKTFDVSAKLAATAVEILRPRNDPEAPPTPRRSAEPSRVNGHGAVTEDEPRTPLTRQQELVKTLDDDDDVVAEFAEPGAEAGAGAQLEVEEPWPGYAQMNAATIVARIEAADQAELALLELYEQTHKKRQTVLTAANRRLRALSPPQAE